jgi:hypothetical protein
MCCLDIGRQETLKYRLFKSFWTILEVGKKVTFWANPEKSDCKKKFSLEFFFSSKDRLDITDLNVSRHADSSAVQHDLARCNRSVPGSIYCHGHTPVLKRDLAWKRF